MVSSKILSLCSVLFLSCVVSCQEKQPHHPVPESHFVPVSTSVVGGGCDGCAIMYVDMPEKIDSEHISDGWHEKGQKLEITGTIYQSDGKTPAPEVVIYYWHTNASGLYASKSGLHPKAIPHGYLRGWVKTDANGKYTLKTCRPAPYPNENLPAHIHLSIKEPDVANEYYADDINFDDDQLLVADLKKYPRENRCGSGIVRTLWQDEVQVAEHDLVLGLNIPNYPKATKHKELSGLNIGDDQPSFIPFHAYGPDQGSRACPVCKYGRYHGIVYFVGSKPNWPEIKQWLTFLEQESRNRKLYLKTYFVYGNEQDYDKEKRQLELQKIGEELHLTQVALTFVPSFSDTETEANLNKINSSSENTFIIYKHRRIVDKFIDLKPNAENFNLVLGSLDRTKGNYFHLPEPNPK